MHSKLLMEQTWKVAISLSCMRKRTAKSLMKCVAATLLLVAVEAETGEEMTLAIEATMVAGTVTVDAMEAILVITTVKEVEEDVAAAAVGTEDTVAVRTEVVVIAATETTVTAAEITGTEAVHELEVMKT